MDTWSSARAEVGPRLSLATLVESLSGEGCRGTRAVREWQTSLLSREACSNTPLYAEGFPTCMLHRVDLPAYPGDTALVPFAVFSLDACSSRKTKHSLTSGHNLTAKSATDRAKAERKYISGVDNL
eukprot:5415210-Prymnesium_polylepis.4